MRSSILIIPHGTTSVHDTAFSLLELLNLILRVSDLHHVELRMLVIILDDADSTDTLQQAEPYRHSSTDQHFSTDAFFDELGKVENVL